MKFAPMERGKRAHTTEIVNLSRSGIAFTVTQKNSPRIGETIKIEFAVPHSDLPVAWIGRVVRLQQVRIWGYANDEEVLVAVTFSDLPKGHEHAVSQGLSAAFRKIRKNQRRRRFFWLSFWVREHLPRILLVLGAITVFLVTLYFVTRPDENYNPEAPTPWGERKF